MRNHAIPAAALPEGEQHERTVDATPLLAINGDLEFITGAYLQLFDRIPEIDGLLHHRFLLRAGVPRVGILSSLARSAEGRACGVVLTNLPAAKVRGLAGRLAFYIRLKARWLFWRLIDRTGEAVEARNTHIDPSRFWDLTYQATITLINRQQLFESQLHVWRREMEERGMKIEAALDGLASKTAATQPAWTQPPGGEVDLGDLKLALPAEEWEVLAKSAFSRYVPRGLAELLKRELIPGMVVADAGAGAGVFSVCASRAIFPGGRLYAMEAMPSRFALLARNLESNGILATGRCVVLPVSAAAAGGVDGVDEAGAPVRSLDSILAVETRVDLVRLSLDGAEAAAVQGMSQLAASNASLRILWDCRPEALARRGGDAGKVLAPLIRAGFRAWKICPVTGTLLPLPKPAWTEPLLVWLARNTSAEAHWNAGGAQCK